LKKTVVACLEISTRHFSRETENVREDNQRKCGLGFLPNVAASACPKTLGWPEMRQQYDTELN
jgi:hypothetical protein